MIHIRTLTDLSSNQSIWAFCNGCKHANKLNLVRIVNSVGDISFNALIERLRCKECGSTDTEIRCVWEGNARDKGNPRIVI